MARVRRLIVPGAVYHVTARGNRKQQIFFDRSDYQGYLRGLATKSQALGLELLGWCLMPNHVHLLARERQTGAMAKTILAVHSAFATRFNRKHEQTSGHVWQARYYSSPIPRHRIWTVLRYIELNPVRANLVTQSAKFEWSTARFHLGDQIAPPFLSLADWTASWTSTDWREALRSGPNCEEENSSEARANSGAGKKRRPSPFLIGHPYSRNSPASEFHSVCPHLFCRRGRVGCKVLFPNGKGRQL